MRVRRHEGQHFLDSLLQANHDRAADDAVADVQLDQVGDSQQGLEIAVMESMAGVDLQASLCASWCRLESAGSTRLHVRGFMKAFGEAPGAIRQLAAVFCAASIWGYR